MISIPKLIKQCKTFLERQHAHGIGLIKQGRKQHFAMTRAMKPCNANAMTGNKELT